MSAPAKLMKTFNKEKLVIAQNAIKALCESCSAQSSCSDPRFDFCPVRRAETALKTEWLLH